MEGTACSYSFRRVMWNAPTLSTLGIEKLCRPIRGFVVLNRQLRIGSNELTPLTFNEDLHPDGCHKNISMAVLYHIPDPNARVFKKSRYDTKKPAQVDNRPGPAPAIVVLTHFPSQYIHCSCQRFPIEQSDTFQIALPDGPAKFFTATKNKSRYERFPLSDGLQPLSSSRMTHLPDGISRGGTAAHPLACISTLGGSGEKRKRPPWSSLSYMTYDSCATNTY